MTFQIRMGIPEMEEQWTSLCVKVKAPRRKKGDLKVHKKWGKAMALLAADPRHPGLHSHDIDPLSHRFGQKVFQSYLENDTPQAGRLFWVYGPNKGEITVIGLEPHPEDSKNSGYAKVRLSAIGKSERSVEN